MIDQYVLGGEFFLQLGEIDERIARQVASERCPHCGGPLHRGDYFRKPRTGTVVEGVGALVKRFGLCCGHCRQRVTPPSLRFLGRRVYVGATILVVSALFLLAERLTMLQVGVPRRTIRRWLDWWHGPFLASEAFVLLRASLLGADISRIPASFLGALEGANAQKVRTLLSAMLSLSTETVANGSRYSGCVA